MKKILILLLFVSAASILVVCGSGEPQPRSEVLDFVNALHKNQPIDLNNYLDMNQIVREDAANVYIYNDSLTLPENIQRFTDLFEPGGRLRQLWTNMQIVIGDTEVRGDTALVEVSFIDRQTRRQFYNKWGLIRTGEGWRIFAFKLL